MRRREHPPAPAPAFGDLAEDFTAFSLRARLGTDTLDGVAVEVHGPSGEVTGGWIEADEDYVPPFHGVGYRPLEAGRHALTVFQRGGELARLAFDVPEAARIPRRWARLSDSRQRALLDWLDGCGATVVVDRMCKVALPLRSFAGADPPPLGAELRAAREDLAPDCRGVFWRGSLRLRGLRLRRAILRGFSKEVGSILRGRRGRSGWRRRRAH